MPLQHQPQSLRTQTLATVAKNFDRLCYSCHSPEQMRRLIETDEYLSVKGPFEFLPPEILEDMAEEMKHVTHLRRHHLHMFITPNLKVWTSHGIGDQLLSFQMLRERCKNLRTFNISYMRHINPGDILQLAPCLSNIVSLNLKMTLAVDQMMYLLGRQCQSLVELNISGTPITDCGLTQLCISDEGIYQCQKLSKLVVSESSNITPRGATIVLRSLPNLRNFDYDHIFEALELTEQWDEEMESRMRYEAGVRLSASCKPVSELALETLISAAEYVRYEGVESAMRLCPSTTTVVLSNAWLSNEILYKFMILENLTSLSITNSEGLTLDFHDGVLPLISACRYSLQNLILANFTNVDVTEIGKTCHYLRNLALSSIAHYETVVTPCPDYFTHLEALEIWSDPDADVNQNMIKQCVAFSEMIHNLLFKGCNNLSDTFLEDVWQRIHSFKIKEKDESQNQSKKRKPDRAKKKQSATLIFAYCNQVSQVMLDILQYKLLSHQQFAAHTFNIYNSKGDETSCSSLYLPSTTVTCLIRELTKNRGMIGLSYCKPLATTVDLNLAGRATGGSHFPPHRKWKQLWNEGS